jgi:hypothetical protein
MKIARFKNITILLTIFIVVSSCDKDQDIYGCTDIEATNYLEEVNIDDDNCLYMYVIEYEVKNTPTKIGTLGAL